MRAARYPRYGFFGHHKCATTWVQYLVHAVCQPLALSYRKLPTPSSFGGNLLTYLDANPTDFLCYTNAELNRVEPLLDRMRAFHLIRDTRDIVVSAYFSHKHSHISKGWPELDSLRKTLSGLGVTEGLLCTIDNLAALPIQGEQLRLWASMSEWAEFRHPNLMELRYEALVANPYEMFVDLLSFLGLAELKPFGLRSQLRWMLNHCLRAVSRRTGLAPRLALAHRIPTPIALKVCHQYSFRRITGGRTPGTEDPRHHFRKGIPGDWKALFTDPVIDHFKRRTGDLLVKLGYETDQNWTT